MTWLLVAVVGAACALALLVGLVLALVVLRRVARGGVAEVPRDPRPARSRVVEVGSAPAVAGRAVLRAVAVAATRHSVWLELGLDTAGGILSSGRITLDVEVRTRSAGAEAQRTLVVDHDGEDTRVTPSPGPGLLAMRSSWPPGHVVESRRLFDLDGLAEGTPVEIEVTVVPRRPLSRFDVRLWLGAAPTSA